MTTTLPPITGDRGIDWLNELMPQFPSLTANYNLAALMVIRESRPDIAAWVKANFGGAPIEQVLEGFFGRALVTWAAIGAGPPAGGNAVAMPSDYQFTDAVQKLMAVVVQRYVPVGWQPTPRAPVVSTSDMGALLANPRAELVPIIAALRADPTGDALLAVARDLAALAHADVVVRTGVDLNAHAVWVALPAAAQTPGDVLDPMIWNDLRSEIDPTKPWTETLPPAPAWLPLLQGPIANAIAAGAVAAPDPFKQQRRGEGALWCHPTYPESAARALAAAFLSLAWTQANYPTLPARLRAAGY